MPSQIGPNRIPLIAKEEEYTTAMVPKYAAQTKGRNEEDCFPPPASR